MDQLNIKICTGTTCYVMGGAELLQLEKRLPKELKTRVRVEGAVCLGYCEDQKNGRAPFAQVDGVVVPNASVEKILQILEQDSKNG